MTISRVERYWQEKINKKLKRQGKFKKCLFSCISVLMAIKFSDKTAAALDYGERDGTGDGNKYCTDQAKGIQQFITTIAPSAKSICEQSDLYPSVMIAQAILESHFGHSKLAQAPYYNLFGVKGINNGYCVEFSTKEYLNGQWVEIKQPFRCYDSYYSSMLDQANILRNTSFYPGVYHYSGAWRSNTNSYLEATSWLTGTYATAPDYGVRLNQLINEYNLTAYDQNANQPDVQYYSQSTLPEEFGTEKSEGVTSLIIREGDTLWDISQRYGISVEELMQKNNLADYILQIGQTLYL
jgi:flagellum-specific peptidoglycan hydrolase FlgJ